MDVVYVLGTGSQWGDAELRHSLRSVYQNLRGVGQVFVVGAKPRFSAGYIHIPTTDRWQVPACNINDALRAACASEAISKRFLRMDDDTFLLRPQDAEAPYYIRGDLAEHTKARSGAGRDDLYYQSLKVTTDWLRTNQLPLVDFEIHGPIVFDKANLRAALELLEPEKPFLIRSVYANLLRLPGQFVRDCKINVPMDRETLSRRLEGRDFFSVGDRGLNLPMKEFLEKRFVA